MKNYSTINVSGRTHVLREIPIRGGQFAGTPNYLNTGKALCGIIKKEKTFEDWKKEQKKKIKSSLNK